MWHVLVDGEGGREGGSGDALTLLPRQCLATKTAPVFLKGSEVCPVHSSCPPCLVNHKVQGRVGMSSRSVSELCHVPISVLFP